MNRREKQRDVDAKLRAVEKAEDDLRVARINLTDVTMSPECESMHNTIANILIHAADAARAVGIPQERINLWVGGR
jgi:hypothetical protein